MSDQGKASEPPSNSANAWGDCLGGTSLGLLLGLLIGLSVTSVVSIVITALVALLAGIFGLSNNGPLQMSAAGVRRLATFGFAAALFTLVGLWIRTNDVFAPSVEQQKATLKAIGYTDGSKEQSEMLRYLRFGLLPTGVTASKEPQASRSVLYANVSPGFCDDLARTTSTLDLLNLFSLSTSALRRVGERIKNLPPEKQAVATDYAKIFLCTEP